MNTETATTTRGKVGYIVSCSLSYTRDGTTPVYRHRAAVFEGDRQVHARDGFATKTEATRYARTHAALIASVAPERLSLVGDKGFIA